MLHKTLFSAVASLVSLVAAGQCHFVRANTTGTDTATFTGVGGSFQNFGCSPIDPTFWMSGGSDSITVHFMHPVDHPSIRVWGMNNDDIASVSVNGAHYAMTDVSATIGDLVACGTVGTTGVSFINGDITGPITSNFSYQDIALHTNAVNTMTIAGLAGAGWGFAGVLVACPLGIDDTQATPLALFPNPASGYVRLSGDVVRNAQATLTDATGQLVLRARITDDVIDLVGVRPGVYAVQVRTCNALLVRRLVVE